MKKAFDKIKERLAEKIEITWKHDYAGGRKDAFNEAIEIVDQVAAECGNDVVYNLAMSYAICLSKYGVDITEKLETATQNAYALNQAYMRGRQEERDKFDKWREEFADDTNVGHKNGWIPCSERLPKECGDYYVTQYNEDAIDEYCDGYRTEKIFFDDNGWWCDIDSSFGWEIIAWQSIPEPYKEK